jgi:hypothetical protein
MYSVTLGLKLPTYKWALLGASAAAILAIEFILYSIIETDDKRGGKKWESRKKKRGVMRRREKRKQGREE